MDGMGKFDSYDHYIYYYCGQESLRRNGVALIVKKRVRNAGLGCSLKNDNDFSLFPRHTIQNHSNPSLCPTSNAEEAEVEQFYDDLYDLLELTPTKDVLFITGDWNAKVGNQEIPGVTGKCGLGVQNETGQRLKVLPKECTGHSKHPLPTTQAMTLDMDITRWSTPKSD